MQSTIETVEFLTDIIARQAGIISKLCSVIEQLAAYTSIDEEIKEVQNLASKALEGNG